MGVVEVPPAIGHRHVDPEEVAQPLIVSSANRIDRHLVTSEANTFRYPRNGEIRAFEAQKQDMDMVPLRLQVREKPRQSPTRESRLECEIGPVGRSSKSLP